MAQALELAAPVMRRPAGLQQDLGGRALGEEAAEGGPREPLALLDLAGDRGHGHLEDRLGEIDADLHTGHGTPPPGWWPSGAVSQSWHVGAVGGGVHPITWTLTGRGRRFSQTSGLNSLAN